MLCESGVAGVKGDEGTEPTPLPTLIYETPCGAKCGIDAARPNELLPLNGAVGVDPIADAAAEDAAERGGAKESGAVS